MKKRVLILTLLVLMVALVACSSNDSADETDMSELQSTYSNEIGRESMDKESSDDSSEESIIVSDEDTVTEAEEIESDRMIIHQAHLHVQVKSLEKTQQNIEVKVDKYDGYIVESNVYKNDDEYISGLITVRIPEEHFQSFLSDTEEEATEVLERNVSGQDVTEQYVDLESRLKSKQAVETRLFEFMKDAEKTEDLLKISSDLATVQEEIELIVGKMNFLENQTAYSTVEISMFEKSVNIPEVDSDKLDTWEKTKKQLATSLNFLLMAGSGLIVFFIGNFPIILLLLLVGTIIYLFIKRRMNKE